MARKSDPSKALAASLIGLGLGLGLMAMAGSDRADRRREFYQVLRAHLTEYGVDLVTAELGRRRGDAVWVIAVEVAGRLASLDVAVGGPDPYSTDVAVDVAAAVAESLGLRS